MDTKIVILNEHQLINETVLPPPPLSIKLPDKQFPFVNNDDQQTPSNIPIFRQFVTKLVDASSPAKK